MGQPEQVFGTDGLLTCLQVLCKFHGQQASAESILSGIPLEEGRLTPSTFGRAAKRLGFTSQIEKQPLSAINSALLPAVLLLSGDRACVLHAVDFEKGAASLIFPQLPDSEIEMSLEDLSEEYTGTIVYCRPRFSFDSRAPRTHTSRKGHWFWSVIAENQKLYRDICIAALMINVFAVSMPLFVMNVYDRVVPNHATHTLWVLATGLLIALSADLLLRLMRGWFIDLAASRSDAKLSATIMERVLGLSLAHRPQSAGAFAANVQSFESVRSFVSSMTVVGLVDLPFVLLFLLVIMLISWPLGVPVIVGATGLIIYASIAQRRLRELSDESMSAGSQRNATLVEGLSNLESVKSFGVESRIQSTYERTSLYMSNISARLKFISSTIQNGAQWCQHLVSVAIIILGVYLIIAGELSQGGLIAAYLLSSRAMAPVSQAAGLLAQYHQAATALRTLDEIMALPQERAQGKNWVSRPVLSGKVEFRDVQFQYPESGQQALTGISIKVKAGERVAVLGKNGSGKSTIQRLLLGLYFPVSGTISLDDVDLRQLDPAELRRNIGYVPQDVELFYGSLRDNIMLSRPVADEELLRVAELSGLKQYIDSHPDGFDLQVGERGQRLSGGQRQSVAIARAMVGDPPILLLDEPTGSLDHSSEEHFKRSLAKAAEGKTVVMVTHRTALLELADRIVVLDAGRVVADGAKATVIEALRQGKIRGAS
ncbi:type I secretion system permease/ATPase [Marinobacter sp. 1_MG-2023]|uniref:type I secretion system permease/ATPase n=1 Tax=Marinobacter sp. 1_MG-2023 TaxID=3062627 RepID=UPI0026E38893|nr:type I secretion system permease/ATPase [Marinobacter sp. 1_MG-2023]MDO6822467.1 type I secretion system permease/ATPase [Marinobacter sp. 1_MG-2023]